MKRSTLIAAAFAVMFIFVLAACSGLPEPLIVTPQPTAVPVVLPDNEQDCLAQGGAWGPQGMLQQDMCDLPATDAGKPCTDSSQCQGLCLASDASSTGTCSPRVLNFGCFDVIEDGVKMGLCID
jgi:hypothetical protein